MSGDGHRFPRCAYCGDLGWTLKKFGVVLHKHTCPYRTDTKCQSHPEFCEEMGQ